MKYTIVVYTADTERASTALRFAETLVEQGHDIYRLFFFGQGVRNGIAPQGQGPEDELRQGWQVLIQTHGLDAVLCVTSASKYGLATGPAAGSGALPLAPGFTISGLGQLIDAAVQTDRLITFGD